MFSRVSGDFPAGWEPLQTQQEHIIDKYGIYADIHERLVSATVLADKTDEGRLMVAVVGQAIMDAMGLYGSDKERVYIPNERGVRGFRKYTTEQQIAIEWFRAGEHSKFCDMVEINPSWVTSLIKTKAGVVL